MSKAFAAAYVAMVAFLAYGGVVLWRTHCEGFGCTGVGVAWLAWSALFALVFIVGLIIRSLSSLSTLLLKISKVAFLIQVLGGVSLLVVWVSKNVA